MYTFLLILLILDSLVLIAAILLQAGKGGGLAASFGGSGTSMDAAFGSRQAGNLLTKTSWWAGGIFIALAFILQVASARTTAPKSILDESFRNQPAPATAPATGGAANPAVPLENAPPAAPQGGTKTP